MEMVKVKCPDCSKFRMVSSETWRKHYKYNSGGVPCLSCSSYRKTSHAARMGAKDHFLVGECRCVEWPKKGAASLIGTEYRCGKYGCEHYDECLNQAAKRNWRGWRVA
jgi:hypothetical protein